MGAAVLVAGQAYAAPILTERPDLSLFGADEFLNNDVNFVTQARIGQPFNNAQTELSNGYDTSNPANFDEAHFQWGNGSLSDFSIDFDGTFITYTVGGTTVIWEDVANQVEGNTLVMRMRATRTPNDGTFTSALLRVDDFAQGGDTTNFNQNFTVTSTDAQGWNTIVLTGIDLSAPWTLTGGVGFGWDGTIRSSGFGSDPAIQFKGGDTVVPEPATMTLLGLGLAGAAWRARKKRA